MIALLGLMFLVVPLVELYVIVEVSGSIGVPETLLLLVAVSVVGGWLVKQQGLGLLRRLSSTIDAGQMPHRELVDGFLILFAGALLLTPGFLTDILAIALLLPPIRAGIRAVVLRTLRRRLVPGPVRVMAAGPRVYRRATYRDAASRPRDPDPPREATPPRSPGALGPRTPRSPGALGPPTPGEHDR